MKKKWIYKNCDEAKVREMADRLGVSDMVARLLVNRNITCPKEAQNFLNPDLSRLHNPFLLPDVEKAVLRVRQAIDAKEKILVYGDRDVDGVTSIAILVRTLKNLGAEVCWTVPSNEGYGLHRSILERFAGEGVKIVITVDTGTSAVDEIAFANSLGLSVIVTDHHLPPPILPPAYAIVNPNLATSLYPMKELAGCLTAFKFAYALMFTFNRTFNQEFVVLDFETTGLLAGRDEIVEVGALKLRNFVTIGRFQTLVKPSKPISAEATRIHGITDGMVADAPPLREVLPKFLEFIGNRAVVAHNAKFDLGFLQVAMKEILNRDFQNTFIDTLALSRRSFSFHSHALTALAKELRIDLEQAHRSMNDCLATAALFQRIEETNDPRLQFFLEDQLDVVTLGTIADIVPLVGENRAIVKHGLPGLLKTRKVGLRKLIEHSGVSSRKSGASEADLVLTSRDISWGVTPLLNAAGRFGRADLAVKLLLTDKEAEASQLTAEIAGLNDDRRALQKTNIDKFLSLAREQCDLEKDSLLFVVAEGVEHGVTGIVANQLMREFQRPVVLLISEGPEATGSSRSIPCFNIVNALERCKELLSRFGGHPAAAGLSLPASNIELLRERLKSIAAAEIAPESIAPQLEIDMELDFDSISTELIREIARLEPFGEGNPPPVFAVRGIRLSDHTVIGAQKNHLRLKLSDKGKGLGAVGWGMSAIAPELKKGEKVDVVFQLEINHWENRSLPQLVLADLRKSEAALFETASERPTDDQR